MNGKNSIKTLEEDLQNVLNKIIEINNEIKEREDKIAGGTLKKGEINFNQSKIDKLKQDIKDFEEEAHYEVKKEENIH